MVTARKCFYQIWCFPLTFFFLLSTCSFLCQWKVFEYRRPSVIVCRQLLSIRGVGFFCRCLKHTVELLCFSTFCLCFRTSFNIGLAARLSPLFSVFSTVCRAFLDLLKSVENAALVSVEIDCSVTTMLTACLPIARVMGNAFYCSHL